MQYRARIEKIALAIFVVGTCVTMAGTVLKADFQDLGPDDWFDQLEELALEHGEYVPLGRAHAAAFLDTGRNLLVSFENSAAIRRQNPGQEPLGFGFVRDDGWASLSIIARGETWFRDPTVWSYFDRLIDDGFFEDFDNVLFYGAGSSGYAAAAYSVAAPGGRLLAIRPQATLDPSVAGWDHRYADHRRRDFTSRYGFAPDMTEALQSAVVLFDPTDRMDAMHSALFRREHTLRFPCPLTGWRLDQDLMSMGILREMIRNAMAGRLTRASLARLYRARRDHVPYLQSLLAAADRDQRPDLARRVCSFALRHRSRPFFARRLAELEGMGRPPSPAAAQ